jgi:hypothetical protein
MFEAANIGEWRGHDVADAQGHKIGGLEAVCVDTRTGLPSFGTVKAGTPARHGSCWCLLTGQPWVRGTSRSATARSK